jgi:hypothetical protein
MLRIEIDAEFHRFCLLGRIAALAEGLQDRGAALLGSRRLSPATTSQTSQTLWLL